MLADRPGEADRVDTELGEVDNGRSIGVGIPRIEEAVIGGRPQPDVSFDRPPRRPLFRGSSIIGRPDSAHLDESLPLGQFFVDSRPTDRHRVFASQPGHRSDEALAIADESDEAHVRMVIEQGCGKDSVVIGGIDHDVTSTERIGVLECSAIPLGCDNARRLQRVPERGQILKIDHWEEIRPIVVCPVAFVAASDAVKQIECLSEK